MIPLNTDFSGGWRANSSIEYLDHFTNSWHISEGVSRVRHCMVILPRGQMVLIGGHYSGNKVEMYDHFIEEWMSLPDIKAYRSFPDVNFITDVHSTNSLTIVDMSF